MPAAASTFPVALFFGVMALGALGGFALFKSASRSARSASRTPASAFSRDIADGRGAMVRPQLSPGGRVAMLFACVAAVLGAGITWATLAHLGDAQRFQSAPSASAEVINPSAGPHAPVRYRFAAGGHLYEGTTRADVRGARHITVRYLAADPAQNRALEPALPVSLALLMPLTFILAFFTVALHLRRDYALARRGQLTRGRIVGYAFGGYSVLAYYDFLAAPGEVLRGSSFLANYTSASAYLKTAPGASVEVYYLAEKPACNGLQLGLWWTR